MQGFCAIAASKAIHRRHGIYVSPDQVVTKHHC